MRMSTAIWAQARSRAADRFCRWCLLGALAGSVHAGLLDESFDLKLPPTNYILSMLIQPDGKIIVSGRFTTNVLEVPRSRIARLNPDGTVDNTFDPENRLGLLARSLALQPDGKVVVAGAFTNVAGIALQNVARLDTNGGLDAGFRPPRSYRSGEESIALQTINRIALQPDGKLLVMGDRENSPSTGYTGGLLARLNPDGTQDTTFMPFLVGPDQRLQCFTLSSTGGILVGRGVPDIFTPSLLRLTPTGTLDVSFTYPLELQRTYGSARSLTVLPDDTLVVVFGEGCFYTASPLLRLLPDGAIDPAFSPPRFAPILPPTHMECAILSIDAVLVQPDGRIVVAGAWNDINGFANSSVVRLMPDGAVDTAFVTVPLAGAWYFPSVKCAALQPDGSIVVGGDFHLAGVEPPRQGLIRLRSGESVMSQAILESPTLTSDQHFSFRVRLPLATIHRIEASYDLEQWSAVLTNEAPEPNYLFIDTADAVGRQRFYRIRPWQGQ